MIVETEKAGSALFVQTIVAKNGRAFTTIRDMNGKAHGFVSANEGKTWHSLEAKPSKAVLFVERVVYRIGKFWAALKKKVWSR